MDSAALEPMLNVSGVKPLTMDLYYKDGRGRHDRALKLPRKGLFISSPIPEIGNQLSSKSNLHRRQSPRPDRCWEVRRGPMQPKANLLKRMACLLASASSPVPAG
jgi:hypothetical protein